MFYPEELIEEVRIRNDIIEVVSSYVKLERKGRRYFGLCPFHNEKSPSFCIEPAKQFFYCFGCNKGGSVIQFIMGIEHLDFLEALKFLAERAGIDLPEPEDAGEKEKSRMRAQILEVNKEAARFFFSTLAGKNGARAQGYLIKRGLTEKTIRQFGLGLAPGGWNDLTKALLNKGAEKNLLLSSGLSIETKNGELVDRFRDRIIFPIFNIRGNIIGFGGRVIDGSQPKYMNSPDTPVYNKSRELYGLNYARQSKSRKLLIVEGYMDVISLHQAGIDYAVASLGTALTQSQAWILKKYAEEVIIAYDSDSAGQAATMRGLDILEKAGCNIRVLIIPDGKDPDDYIRNNGPEKFKNLVDRAISLLDYKIRAEKNMYSLDTVDDRLKLLNSIADILAAHDNSIERELYTKNYAEQYGISLESLNSEVQKRRNRKQSGNRTYSLNKNTTQTRGLPEFLSVDSRYGELEYMLLVMLCNDNRLFSKVSKEYNTGAYMDEGARKIAEKLYNRLEQNKNCVLAELLNVLDPKEASYMVRITEINSGLEDTDKAVQQILNKLEILKLEDLQKQTIERIKNEEDGIKRQELGLEFSKRAERIAELKRLT
ncbi:MAG: DNA primase [Clostridiaceae bacterium]|nr:DNA primase [Clostridiaceae bacterium]